MSDSDRSRRPRGGSREHVSPKVVLLAAYRTGDEGADETSRWTAAFDFSATVSVPGIEEPVVVDPDREVALVVTGIGNAEAAVSVGALLASPRIDCGDAYFVTVGSAGAPPTVATVGSVVINDRVLDWDQKHRRAFEDTPDGDAQVAPFSFKSSREVCKELNPALVEAAREIGATVDLADSADLRSYRRQYPSEAARSGPTVTVGGAVSGSEFWRGKTCAEQARWLAEHHAATYSTTEMEGFGTALALQRHGLLDRYLSVRGVSNFDRPAPGQPVDWSFQDEHCLVALENAYRVGRSVIERIVEDWADWREGVPARRGTVSD